MNLHSVDTPNWFLETYCFWGGQWPMKFNIQELPLSWACRNLLSLYIAISKGSRCEHRHLLSLYIAISKGSRCEHRHLLSLYIAISKGSRCEHRHLLSLYIAISKGSRCEHHRQVLFVSFIIVYYIHCINYFWKESFKSFQLFELRSTILVYW